MVAVGKNRFRDRTGSAIPAIPSGAPGTRSVDPETGQARVECPGFNDKNDCPRSTPCHPDHLLKTARDTEVSELLDWCNGDVQRIFRQRRFFDKAGLFIGDGSYLFVPDNPTSQWIAKVNRTTSFSDCPVPLDVVLCTTGKDPAADDSLRPPPG